MKKVFTKSISLIVIFLVLLAWTYDYPPTPFLKNFGGHGWPQIRVENRYVSFHFPPRVREAYAASSTIFLTGTASTTWAVPSDWNNNENTIEVIGGGGGGGGGGTDGQNVTKGGGGAAGGVYAKAVNVNLPKGGTVTIKIGTAGGGGATEVSGTAGGDTFFCNATANCASIAGTAVVAGGKGGGGGAGAVNNTLGTGGTVPAGSVGSTINNGGAGGTGGVGGTESGGGGAGAGGAGGQTAAGTAGVNGSVGGNRSGGPGGNGGAGGTTGGGTAGTGGANPGEAAGNPGGVGGNGTNFDATHGAGGGGGGASGGGRRFVGGAGGAGGNYGAGGGGGGGTHENTGTTNTGGAGKQGLIVITYTPAAFFEQSAYRWFSNNNSSTVGAALTAAQDASTTLSASGDAFRLRMLLHVSNSTSTAGKEENLKLQYASTTPGNCSPAFYGSSAFVDAATSTGEIRYNGNALPADGALLGATSTDPTHGGDTIVNQTYEEENNFTVTSTISSGKDGKWDFSLIDFSAPGGTTYCFRVVYSNGVTITTSTSSKIPEIKTTAAANSPPTVSGAVLNGASAITLTPNTTTTITAVASTTDPDGAGDIRFATSSIYRSGVGVTCTADNLNCYQIASSSCSFADATSSVSCSAQIYFFAQATDASSSFAAENWLARITVTDSVPSAGSSTSSGVELNTLLAIDVTPATTTYGTLFPNTNTGSTNQTSSVKNAGNASTTLRVSGTALTLGANSIATSSQRYATSSFTFGGSEQVVSSTTQTVSGFRLTSPTSTNAVSSLMFWGIEVPTGTATGTYSGTNTFTAVFAP